MTSARREVVVDVDPGEEGLDLHVPTAVKFDHKFDQQFDQQFDRQFDRRRRRAWPARANLGTSFRAGWR
jgi:hypothetical protein